MVVGDPTQAERVAGLFDGVRVSRKNREFTSFTGSYQGIEITVMATGIGCDNTEIAVIELCQLRFPLTVIRCGSCGGLQPDMEIGDLVISSGALRHESTSGSYAPPELPALAHPEVTMALAAAAHGTGHPYHVGLTATLPGFYGPQGRDLPPFSTRHPGRPAELARLGVLNLEMEASCLFGYG